MTASEFLDLNNSAYHALGAASALLVMSERLGTEPVRTRVKLAQAALREAISELEAIQRESRRQADLKLSPTH